VTNVVEELKGLAGEQVTKSKTVPEPTIAPPLPEVAPFISLTGQEESISSKDMQPGSPTIMMTSIGFAE